MKFFIVSICVLLMSSGIYADTETTQDIPNPSAFAKCLDADSISCLQMTLFRRAKSIFDNPQIELFGGVSLMKSSEGRQGKSIDDNSIAVEVAPSVEARNSELGTYFVTSLKNFFQERSLNFNFANTARSIARAIPDDIKADIKDLIVEGRTTKKKRVLKKLLPVILGIGAKVAVLAIGSMFGLLLIAKKALIVSVVAFGLALFAGISGLGRGGSGGGSSGGGGGLLGSLGGLFGGGKGSGGGGGGYSGGNAGWSTGGSGGWSGGGGGGGSGWDSHGAYSSPVAQSVAYSGYKQARR